MSVNRYSLRKHSITQQLESTDVETQNDYLRDISKDLHSIQDCIEKDFSIFK